MGLQVVNKIKQLDHIEAVFVNKKRETIFFVDKDILGFESISLKLAKTDDGQYYLTDDGMIAQEMNLFFARHVVGEEFIVNRIKKMTNVDVQRLAKHIVIFNSRYFTIDSIEKECNNFIDDLIKFAEFVERHKNEIQRP